MTTVKKIPLRKCTGCGQMKSKKEMLRILKTTEGEILLDRTGKKNGRGAYLCCTHDCLEKAFKNKGLERSLKCQIPADLIESLKKELMESES